MVFIKQRARTSFAKTSGSAVPPAGRAYRSLIWARGWVRRGGNLLMNIGLRSRATAPGPTCSASGSLIRARHRVRRGGVRRTRKLPHDGTDPEARPSAFWRKVRDSGAGNIEMEMRSLLKSGSEIG